MPGARILLTLILLAGLASAGVKVSAALKDGQVAAPQESLSIPGLLPAGKVNKVNRGDFDISLYRAVSCAGGIAALRLDKNAEGAHVLAHSLGIEPETVRFVLNGKIHTSFPAFGLFVTRALGGREGVLAVAEFGQCNLINTLSWPAA